MMAAQRPKRRIAFFGGSFDPVHEGHLAMARAALDGLGLDRVCFVPARQNPLKKDVPGASGGHRVEMLRLAVGEDSRLGIWDGELGRDGPSYTLESVRQLGHVYPNSHHFWVVGTDQLASLPRWYGIEQLVHQIGFILVQRPGYEWSWPGIPGLRLYPVTNPEMPVSSTEVRRRLEAGKPIRGLVPPAVEAYIARHHLYRQGNATIR